MIDGDKSDPTRTWFAQARYGLFVHFGLYSKIGRGEWVRNREGISRGEYAAVAAGFDCAAFDAAAICDLAVRAGMKYVVFTTMHHDGFRLYDSELSDFSTARTAARRDLVAEMLAAAMARGLRFGLYHSLNSWHDQPDAVQALEDPAVQKQFVDATHARVAELVRKFPSADLLWYDGWWPFNADGWRSEEMNAMVRRIAPGILFNGRNGLPGDFATPEGHLSAPRPWRPWEGCMTTNNNWGYHVGDTAWKNSRQIAEMVIKVASGAGNLLLNIGPRGDGSLPPEAVQPVEEVGAWLQRHGEAIRDSELFNWDLRESEGFRADWSHHGPFTIRGNNLYWHVLNWAGSTSVLDGLQVRVLTVTLLGQGPIEFTQEEGKLVLRGLPERSPDRVIPVLRLVCDSPPRLYLTAGMRVPRVSHPHYDPCPSDLLPS